MNDTPTAEDIHAMESELLQRWPENKVAPDLSREQALMRLLGDPQFSAPTVHVAGTNGKTSTVRLIDAIIHQLDLTTGRYTSPHLHTIRERIAFNGESITVDAWWQLYHETLPFVQIIDDQVGHMTMFEVVTGMAFAAFADYPVDAAIVECGMGGRWDATNVVDPSVCVITPIGYDHQEYLGTTIEQIAGEKAGIITANVPVVSGRQDPAALAVLAEQAARHDTQLTLLGRDFAVTGREVAAEGQIIDIESVTGRHEELFLPLYGDYQADNAACAIVAAEMFCGGRRIDTEILRAAFAEVSSPGRWDILSESPMIVADAAHNLDGVRAAMDTITEIIDTDRVVGVIAVLREKNVEEMVEEWSRRLDRVVVCANSSPRSLSAEELRAVAERYWAVDDVLIADSVEDAMAVARDECASWEMMGLTCAMLVTGSVVTVGEARAASEDM